MISYAVVKFNCSGCGENTRPVSGRVQWAELSVVVKCDGRLIWGSVSLPHRHSAVRAYHRRKLRQWFMKIRYKRATFYRLHWTETHTWTTLPMGVQIGPPSPKQREWKGALFWWGDKTSPHLQNQKGMKYDLRNNDEVVNYHLTRHIFKMGNCHITPNFHYNRNAKGVTVRYSLTIKSKGIILCREWVRKENWNGRCSWMSVVA